MIINVNYSADSSKNSKWRGKLVSIMDCIKELQSSHQRLNELYQNLYNNQRQLILHEFGSGKDLSISSLLKFAPIAENFQGHADEYKNELKKFQRLLNTVQQTVRKINVINNPPLNQQSIASKQSQQKTENGVSRSSMPSKKPLLVGSNDDDHKTSYPPSTNNAYRKNAPSKKPYF